MDYEVFMRKHLKDDPKRIKHSLLVQERALELGVLYGACLDVLRAASLLHDITKPLTQSQHQALIGEDVSHIPTPLLHPLSAHALLLKNGITDEKILEAVKYHMWGRVGMHKETMIIVVSDFCERSRRFKMAKRVYEVSKKDLLEAYLLSLESVIKHLWKNEITPSKEQLETYYFYKGENHAR